MIKSTLVSSITLAVTINISLAAGDAFATKLNAQPLPRAGAPVYDRETKEFKSPDELMPTSRFKRRLDYRDQEAKDKEEAEERAKKEQEAKLQAVEEAKKARQSQIDAIQKYKQMAVEFNNKAVAAGKQGKWQEAISNHEEAIKYDSTNKQFKINLSAARVAYGQQRLAQGDTQGAAHMFRKALVSAPDNALASKMLAMAIDRMGMNPNNVDTRISLGDQLAAASDLEGAFVEFQQALQLEPSAKTYVKMGDMYARYGQLTAANSYYRQAVIKEPEYGPAHRQIGLVAMSQKDYTSAASSLRKAVILDSNDQAAGQALVEIWRKQVASNPLLPENHLGLAGALQLTGDFGGADAEYRKLELVDAKNPGLESGRASLARAIQHAKAEKHKLAAETLFNQGLKKEALSEITQAVMMEPRNTSFQFLFGECLESLGDYKGAHQAYFTCVQIDPVRNKEAAARMKQMQGYGSSNSGSEQKSFAPQPQQQQFGTFGGNQQQRQPQQQVFQSTPNQNSDLASTLNRKNMFEGAPQSQPMSMQQAASNPMQQMQMQQAMQQQAMQQQAMQQRAMQQQQAMQQQATQQPVQQAAPQAASASLNDSLAGVTDAEAQRDYASAVNILRQMVTTNVENAEVHHRLAVNLMAMGQITEAVSEFRIASALAPGKKAYQDDLARALAIHKRSLMTDGSTAGATK